MTPVNKIICGDWVEIAKGLPDKLLHCIITSPPYWGQRLYGFGGDGSCEEKEISHQWQEFSNCLVMCENCGMKAPTLGSEKTVEEHIDKLVAGFGILRQKLRDDGVLFLNYGDKYGGGNNKAIGGDAQRFSSKDSGTFQDNPNLRSGDLIGLAWRLALALQADGWILRSDTIWAKAISFCAKYSGSTMPESVNGWRWERCRVKIKAGQIKSGGANTDGMFAHQPMNNAARDGLTAQWRDCPGCAKCEKSDGLVLRRGSWRPTRAHEYLFILTKTGNYYCDMEAVREERTESGIKRQSYGYNNLCGDKRLADPTDKRDKGNRYEPDANDTESGRNLRDVWAINPQAYPEAHYATFPEKLVEPCIKVATSEKGVCPTCGGQWARVVDHKNMVINRSDRGKKIFGNNHSTAASGTMESPSKTTTIGWRPTCGCSVKEPVPAIVYDPFMGSGTVAAVAARLGRNYIGSELNKSYIKEQADYRVAEAETGISKAEQLAGQKGLFE